MTRKVSVTPKLRCVIVNKKQRLVASESWQDRYLDKLRYVYMDHIDVSI